VKKASIGKKVSTLTLRVSLVAVIAVGIVAIAGLLLLRTNTATINATLGEAAAEDSRQALEARMIDNLIMSAEHSAALIDSIMYTYELTTKMIASSASDIVQNPDKYTPTPVAPPDPANGGRPSAQLIWGESVDIDAVMDDVTMMGNISDVILGVADKGTEVAYFIGSEQGYFIMVDHYAHEQPAFSDPRQRPWYIQTVENNALTWTDVYRLVRTEEFSIACAMPYYDAQGNIAGVAATSQNLIFMVDEALSNTGYSAGETQYSFIVNEQGQIVVSQNMETDVEGNVIWEDWLNSDNADLADAAQNMIARKSSAQRVQMDGTEYFIAYAPIETLPWSFVVAIEAEEVIAPALASEGRIITMMNEALRDIDLIIVTVVSAFLGVVACAVLLTGYMSRKFARALTQPVTTLQEGVRQIADGNLEHIIDLHTGDEIEELGRSVNRMALELKEYIANLQTVTAAKERIGAELHIASQIQSSMLPCTFPPFPDRDEFDIYASMIPAKEVGGDFYDFFFIDEDTLAVVIADVSDKGVHSALFMVIAKTLIKSKAQSGMSPKEVFETVNNLLCEGNEARMFVTAFLGYLHLPTGRFTYVNAGHNPPLAKQDGVWDKIRTKSGFVLALAKNREYAQDEFLIRANDEIFLYTDGVTEAMNRTDQLFGEERLFEAVDRHDGAPLSRFAQSLKQEIDQFAEGVDQADDITVLVLRYQGLGKRPASDELVVEATLENMALVQDYVESRISGCSPKMRNSIGIVIDEVFSNIAHYAYHPGSGEVIVRVTIGEDLTIQIEDSGIAFDPLAKEDPDISMPPQEREAGGLGIFMVKNIMDSVEYQRADDKNILTLRKAII